MERARWSCPLVNAISSLESHPSVVKARSLAVPAVNAILVLVGHFCTGFIGLGALHWDLG